jgi:ATP synthase, F1 epsilon subunit (delta in mitochondria)
MSTTSTKAHFEAIPGSGDLVCRVITPERTVFSRKVDSVSLDTVSGRLEIFARFEPTIAPLVVGVMTAKDVDGMEYSLAIHGGYMDMNGTVLVILADSAELGTDVDVERARAALERAREMLNQVTDTNPDHPAADIDRAKLALYRALTRLKVAGADEGIAGLP